MRRNGFLPRRTGGFAWRVVVADDHGLPFTGRGTVDAAADGFGSSPHYLDVVRADLAGGTGGGVVRPVWLFEHPAFDDAGDRLGRAA